MPSFIPKLKKSHFLIIYIGAAVYKYFWVVKNSQLNNFLIFRSSFYHFIKGMSLYNRYPNEYYDLFLYSPAFPIIFSPFALLKLHAGILAWLLFTATLCYFVFSRIPLDDWKIKFFLFFIFFNLLNNLGHTQTTPVMMALMFLFWALQGQKKFYFLRGLLLAICFLIKGYGAIIGLLLLFEKDRLKTILYTAVSFLTINCLLLFFITPELLINQYRDWLTVISGSEIKEHFSVYGILENLSPNGFSEIFILSIAFGILAAYITCEFIIHKKDITLLIAFLLIWVTIFNRGAEAATYIIAMAGVILWHMNRPRRKLTTILFYTTIIISSVFPTGLITFIDVLKKTYYISVFFCLIILGDLLVLKIKEIHQQQLLKKLNL